MLNKIKFGGGYQSKLTEILKGNKKDVKNKYTRVEIIDWRADSQTRGRAYASGIMENVELDLLDQDEGRTLKIFIKDKQKDE